MTEIARLLKHQVLGNLIELGFLFASFYSSILFKIAKNYTRKYNPPSEIAIYCYGFCIIY